MIVVVGLEFEARIAAGPRRETLGADVERLEQVRLAGAVRSDHEHQARLQLELEASVRAEISERDRVDDQASEPASKKVTGGSASRRAESA